MHDETISPPTLTSTAQAIFLSEHAQTDETTEATEHPIPCHPLQSHMWTHTNLIKVQVLRYKPTETGQEVCCQEPFHVRPGVL